MKAYQNLEKIFRRFYNFNHLAAIAHWDMAVMMPEGGSEARSKALAELEGFFVETMNDPKVEAWIQEAEADQAQLETWQKANLREIRHSWLVATSVDQDLVEKKSVVGAKCEMAWRKLRAENNWKEFLPLFKEVVNLSREEAQQRAAATGLSLYDSMLDKYEPSQKSENIQKIFEDYKVFLKTFLPEVIEKQKSEEVHRPKGPFPIENQRALGVELMKAVGFDFNRGRLDVSHHPFCGGVAEDVRITTRYSEEDFIESLMGVLHETGHASYGQNLPANWMDQPVGQDRGMGIHESQSLLFEMQISRGQEFLNFASPAIRKHIAKPGDDDKVWTAENIQRLYTRVEPGFIRVNADEVTYPAHVILRFEIEKDLIEGKIEAEDIPELWNEKMQAYLGLSTEGNYKDGCMQDVHWTDGSFGYFPTYTLGAMNAAQIYKAAVKDNSSIPEEIQKGNLQPLRAWLEEKIWSQGCFHSIDDLMKNATGESLQPKYFIEHLQSRY